jgi:YHS domain-containing protein
MENSTGSAARAVRRRSSGTDTYRSARDPVTGETVDKSTAALEVYAGRVLFFASETTRSAFAKEPGRWLPPGDSNTAAVVPKPAHMQEGQ